MNAPGAVSLFSYIFFTEALTFSLGWGLCNMIVRLRLQHTSPSSTYTCPDTKGGEVVNTIAKSHLNVMNGG